MTRQTAPLRTLLTQDRFLLVILIGIGVLVVVAVSLFFIRGGTQEYSFENTPQSVLHNYIIALEKEDYQRAYGYLKDADGKPEFDRFREAFLTRQLIPSTAALQIGESRQSGDDVLVSVLVIRGSSGPFRNTNRESINVLVVKDEDGDWKIGSLSYPYWGWDWYTSMDEVPPTSRP
jgi:hypothetical protein